MCEDGEVLVLVTTIDKGVVVVDDRFPEAETVSENECVGYTDICGVVLIVLVGVGNDLVEVKAVMAVMLVTLAWSTLEEFESEVQLWERMQLYNTTTKKIITSICLSYYASTGCI